MTGHVSREDKIFLSGVFDSVSLARIDHFSGTFYSLTRKIFSGILRRQSRSKIKTHESSIVFLLIDMHFYQVFIGIIKTFVLIKVFKINLT